MGRDCFGLLSSMFPLEDRACLVYLKLLFINPSAALGEDVFNLWTFLAQQVGGSLLFCLLHPNAGLQNPLNPPVACREIYRSSEVKQ